MVDARSISGGDLGQIGRTDNGGRGCDMAVPIGWRGDGQTGQELMRGLPAGVDVDSIRVRLNHSQENSSIFVRFALRGRFP
jgi:hypothetical protein